MESMYSMKLGEPSRYITRSLEPQGAGGTLLGKGSFGEVYQIEITDHRDQHAKKLIARKVISIEKSHEKSVARESCIMNLLLQKVNDETQHLVRCLSVTKNAHELYIDMELCYQSLQKFMSINRTLQVREALEIMIQITDGARVLRRNNILHRDLKPANILQGKDGFWKIADFGLSIIVAGQQSEANSFVGTIEYMSPEVLRGERVERTKRKSYSFAVDIWSLGVIFFELLQGKVPFGGRDAQDILSQIEQCNVRDRVHNLHTVDDEVKETLVNMLEKNGDRRIDIESLHDELVRHRERIGAISEESIHFIVSDPEKMVLERSMNDGITINSIAPVLYDSSYDRMTLKEGQSLSGHSIVERTRQAAIEIEKLRNFISWELGKIEFLEKTILESYPRIVNMLPENYELARNWFAALLRFLLIRVLGFEGIFFPENGNTKVPEEIVEPWSAYYLECEEYLTLKNQSRLIKEQAIKKLEEAGGSIDELDTQNTKKVHNDFCEAVDGVLLTYNNPRTQSEKTIDELIWLERFKIISKPLKKTFVVDDQYFFNFEKFYYNEGSLVSWSREKWNAKF